MAEQPVKNNPNASNSLKGSRFLLPNPPQPGTVNKYKVRYQQLETLATGVSSRKPARPAEKNLPWSQRSSHKPKRLSIQWPPPSTPITREKLTPGRLSIQWPPKYPESIEKCFTENTPRSKSMRITFSLEPVQVEKKVNAPKSVSVSKSQSKSTSEYATKCSFFSKSTKSAKKLDLFKLIHPPHLTTLTPNYREQEASKSPNKPPSDPSKRDNSRRNSVSNGKGSSSSSFSKKSVSMESQSPRAAKTILLLLDTPPPTPGTEYGSPLQFTPSPKVPDGCCTSRITPPLPKSYDASGPWTPMSPRRSDFVGPKTYKAANQAMLAQTIANGSPARVLNFDTSFGSDSDRESEISLSNSNDSTDSSWPSIETPPGQVWEGFNLKSQTLKTSQDFYVPHKGNFSVATSPQAQQPEIFTLPTSWPGVETPPESAANFRTPELKQIFFIGMPGFTPPQISLKSSHKVSLENVESSGSTSSQPGTPYFSPKVIFQQFPGPPSSPSRPLSSASRKIDKKSKSTTKLARSCFDDELFDKIAARRVAMSSENSDTESNASSSYTPQSQVVNIKPNIVEVISGRPPSPPPPPPPDNQLRPNIFQPSKTSKESQSLKSHDSEKSNELQEELAKKLALRRVDQTWDESSSSDSENKSFEATNQAQLIETFPTAVIRMVPGGPPPTPPPHPPARFLYRPGNQIRLASNESKYSTLQSGKSSSSKSINSSFQAELFNKIASRRAALGSENSDTLGNSVSRSSTKSPKKLARTSQSPRSILESKNLQAAIAKFDNLSSPVIKSPKFEDDDWSG